jgi:hypothetical protein
MLWNVFKKQNKTESAKLLYKRAIEYSNESDLYALSNYWSLCIENEDFEEWEKYLLLAYDINPTYAITSYTLSVLYFHKELYEKSFQYALNALKNSENWNLDHTIMNILFQSAEKAADILDINNILDTYIATLEKEWWKKIIIQQDTSITSAAKVKIAENYWSDNHLVLYNPNKHNYKHLIMHELTHLKLVFSARKKENNKVFVSSRQNIEQFISDMNSQALGLSRLLQGNKEALIEKLEFLCTHIWTQLFNSPIDLIIEEYLHENYKSIRPSQFLNLLTMVEQWVQISNDSKTEETTPRLVFDTNVILNIILAYQLKDLYHVDFINRFKQKKLIKIWEELYNDYLNQKTKLIPWDEYTLVDEWWKKLFLNWYYIVKDENVYINEIANTKNNENKVHVSVTREYNDVKKFEKDFYNMIYEHKDNGKFNDDDINMAVVMYCVSAIQFYKKLSFEKTKEIAFEIALRGASWITYGDWEIYEIKSYPWKQFSWLQFLAYMYVGFQIIAPDRDLGLDYHNEYELAKKIANI